LGVVVQPPPREEPFPSSFSNPPYPSSFSKSPLSPLFQRGVFPSFYLTSPSFSKRGIKGVIENRKEGI